MAADSQAVDSLIGWQPKSSVVQPHSHAVKSATSQTLELQGSMGMIRFRAERRQRTRINVSASTPA